MSLMIRARNVIIDRRGRERQASEQIHYSGRLGGEHQIFTTHAVDRVERCALYNWYYGKTKRSDKEALVMG